MKKVKIAYCKSCRKEYVDVDCETCANKYKGVCDSCTHWKFLKDYYELSPYFVIEESE